MTLPTIVAWSWGADHYHAHARSLRECCEGLGYRYSIEVDADLSGHMDARFGDEWEERQWVYRYIPKFIARKLDEVGDLLYLHADMTIQEPIPESAFGGMDIGLESGWSQYPPRPDDRVLAAPIYVANTVPARRFIRLWRTLCETLDDGMGEHNQLLRTWKIMRKHDRTLRVGIFDPPMGSIRADSDVPIVGTK